MTRKMRQPAQRTTAVKPCMYEVAIKLFGAMNDDGQRERLHYTTGYGDCVYIAEAAAWANIPPSVIAQASCHTVYTYVFDARTGGEERHDVYAAYTVLPR